MYGVGDQGGGLKRPQKVPSESSGAKAALAGDNTHGNTCIGGGYRRLNNQPVAFKVESPNE